MSKEDKHTAREIFEKAMQGVKRMKQDKAVVREIQKALPIIRNCTDDEKPVPAKVTSTEKLFYQSKPLPQHVLAKLKTGKINVDAIIDLHGMYLAEAREYLTHFMNEAENHEHFCICVVHGKGRKTPDDPVLKNAVNQMLRADPRVLAFCSAPAKRGGTGAVYVLLKNR